MVTIWLENFTRTQLGQFIFGRPNALIFKNCLHPNFPFESSFQNNLNFYNWVSNENFMAKILTGCQAGSLRTELRQSIFGFLIGYILQTFLFGIFPYEYILQINLNLSIPISYVNFMTKILTAYHKSSFLKLYFLECSLAYLTYQFLLDSKLVSNGDTYMNILPSPIGITSIRYQTKNLYA